MATVDELHATAKIIDVDPSKLKVDSSYQRDVSEKLVDTIASDWSAIAAELLTVSDRGPRDKESGVEGGLFIVNGQHRAKAAQKLGLTKLDARVINLRKEADPARTEAKFRLETNVRLGDRPLERFKAQLRAGDEESIAIVQIAESFGAEISLVPNETGINCISTVESIYRLDDGALLRQTLKVVKDAYPYVGGKFASADLLKSICWFIEKHDKESDRTRLVGKLTSIGRPALESRARTTQLSMSGALWVNYYRAIVELYNEQLREKSRLQWKLRGKSSLSNASRFASS